MPVSGSSEELALMLAREYSAQSDQGGAGLYEE
jgi:hypothetical protein